VGYFSQTSQPPLLQLQTLMQKVGIEGTVTRMARPYKLVPALQHSCHNHGCYTVLVTTLNPLTML